MTSLRYKNLALNRKRKLLDKEKKERTAKEKRDKISLANRREKDNLRRIIEEERDYGN